MKRKITDSILIVLTVLLAIYVAALFYGDSDYQDDKRWRDFKITEHLLLVAENHKKVLDRAFAYWLKNGKNEWETVQLLMQYGQTVNHTAKHLNSQKAKIERLIHSKNVWQFLGDTPRKVVYVKYDFQKVLKAAQDNQESMEAIRRDALRDDASRIVKLGIEEFKSESEWEVFFQAYLKRLDEKDPLVIAVENSSDYLEVAKANIEEAERLIEMK